MDVVSTHLREIATAIAGIVWLLIAACAGATAGGDVPAGEPRGDAAAERTYYVYAGAESADLLHRVRFGPDGAHVDRTTPVGELSVEMEGPHGLRTSPDGEFLYMTTGHGVPDGKLWKFRAGPDTLVGEPILLGRFPATLELTPDGLYAFVANFNLHGEPVPSTLSVVFTPDMREVGQIETCTMPHGARIHPRGTRLYTVCMADDQLVEVDTRGFRVARRFSVVPESEGPLDPGVATTAGHGRCSPTWAQPSVDGDVVYVACNGGDRILEVDLESWSLRRTFPTGRGPYNLDVTPDGRILVATLKQGGAVEFIDLASGESLAVTPSSSRVTHGVVVSPDSRYAFVTVEGVGAEPGKVDIYDLESFRRVADVDVGQQAGGIAFWRIEDAP